MLGEHIDRQGYWRFHNAVGGIEGKKRIGGLTNNLTLL